MLLNALSFYSIFPSFFFFWIIYFLVLPYIYLNILISATTNHKPAKGLRFVIANLHMAGTGRVKFEIADIYFKNIKILHFLLRAGLEPPRANTLSTTKFSPSLLWGSRLTTCCVSRELLQSKIPNINQCI